MEAVIARDIAETELDDILKYYEIDEEATADQVVNREILIKAIMKGRVEFERETGTIILSLGRPLELLNGQEQKTFNFREPTAGDLKVMDKYKEVEQIARSVALVSKLTGHPIGVIDRIGSKDLQVITAIVTLFT